MYLQCLLCIGLYNKIWDPMQHYAIIHSSILQKTYAQFCFWQNKANNSNNNRIIVEFLLVINSKKQKSLNYVSHEFLYSNNANLSICPFDRSNFQPSIRKSKPLHRWENRKWQAAADRSLFLPAPTSLWTSTFGLPSNKTNITKFTA